MQRYHCQGPAQSRRAGDDPSPGVEVGRGVRAGMPVVALVMPEKPGTGPTATNAPFPPSMPKLRLCEANHLWSPCSLQMASSSSAINPRSSLSQLSLISR